MYQKYLLRLLSFAVLGLMFCSFAYAQDGWNRLESLRKGTRLLVERSNGGQVKGKFASASADALTLETARGRMAITRDDIDSVSLTRRSSRVKRGLVGALAGAGAGVLIGVVATVAGNADPLTAAGGLLVGLPVGAVIGAATTGSGKVELIYRR